MTWKRRLLDLNAWAEPFDQDIESSKFRQARRNACFKRWRQAGEANEQALSRWNNWANAMLVLRKQFEADSPASELYAALSLSDFGTKEEPLCLKGDLLKDINFRQRVFPGKVWFLYTEFGGHAWFNGAQFSGGDAEFDRARFNGGLARFDRARFSGGHAWFGGARFSGGDVRFDGVQFSGGYARFDGVQFNASVRSVSFREAHFAQRSNFENCQINCRITFSGSCFLGEARFQGLHSSAEFDLSDARFGKVPDLTQTTFHREPRVDNMRIASTVSGMVLQDDGSSSPWRDRGAPAKFRELKRYAIANKDTRSELNFYAEEVRSARFVADWPWHARFWLGILYSLFSRFGRSIIRPAVGWLVGVFLFAMFYLGEAPHVSERHKTQPSTGIIGTLSDNDIAFYSAQTGKFSCRPPNDGRLNVDTPIKDVSTATNGTDEALWLSLKNALIFSDWDRSEVARRTYGCLYGFTTDGVNTFPRVPPIVSLVSILQNIFSAIMIFLFLLGLRNMLKLK